MILSIAWSSVKRRDCDRHGLGSKPTSAVLLCPWERHFTEFSRMAVLASSSKFQPDSNILVSPEAGRDNCFLYVRVLASPSPSYESGG